MGLSQESDKMCLICLYRDRLFVEKTCLLVVVFCGLVDIFFMHETNHYFCTMTKTVLQKWMELLAHVAIWVGYSLLIFAGPISNSDSVSMAMFYTIRALLVNSVLFYLNIYVLLPNLIGKNRYWAYVLFIIVMLMVSALFFQLSEQWLGMGEMMKDARMPIPHDGMNDSPGMRPEFGGSVFPRPRPFLMGPGIAFGFMSALGILFISTIFWVMNEARNRRQREMALETENLMTEMKFLKSQINPHFLFNALNNIYALSRLQSAKAPDMILKLSDMLRFVLYESEDKKVPLGREIDYICHYIDFQKIKIEGEPRIVVEMDDVDRSVMIEPMLLIPFVENCFKHSKIEDVRHGWMHMRLTTAYGKLYFVVINSLPSSSVHVDPMGGIGIDNVKKRLNFLYPGKHRLDIERKEKEFRVELVLEMK